MSVIVENELMRSYLTLFGPRFDFSSQTLDDLGSSGIKSAFRKKALETHPDLAQSRGDQALAQSGKKFIAVKQAYERLLSYLNRREQGFSQQAFAWPEPAAAANQASFKGGKRRTVNDFFNGPLPRRKLLFGHFLYYSGVVNFKAIGKAILWQRLQRPRLGELGLDFGWLTEKELELVVRRSNTRQLFGETAIALGLLNEMQVERLLKKQETLKRKLGEYFVEQGTVTPEEMAELIKKFEAHTGQYPTS